MKYASICTMCTVCVLFVQACATTQDSQSTIASGDAEHSEIIKRDLFAIISLQGAPCKEVISYELQDELDYVADCATGDRYRVHVSSEGGVHVREHP